jgi:Ni,Fe-hydrogenase III small subunit/NAD-dependent dihydropyrimidine dehydrogenase PreA subunit
MIGWFLRGVTRRRLTTRYPQVTELPPHGFRARARLDPSAVDPDQARHCVEVCLPDALTLNPRGHLRLDASRCIGCGLCVEAWQDGALTIDSSYELAAASRAHFVIDDGASDDPDPPPHAASGVPAPAGARVERPSTPLTGRAFRRSLHIRHIDTGSDGAVEQETAALLNPYYDMHRLGLFFTASPRHADVLLVSGPVTHPMRQPLLRAFEAMPEPRVVVAAGTDACSGGIWSEPDVLGGVDRLLGVDVYIPGDPPSPIALLHGLLLAAGRVREAEPPLHERQPLGVDPSASEGQG